MGKLVAAIAVVFCLDLAFILFIRGGGDMVEFSQAMNVRFDPIMISRQLEIPEGALLRAPDRDIYDVYDEVIDRVNPGNARTAMPTRIRSSKKRAIARKTDGVPLRSYASEQPAETLTDTVIWIERASYVPDRAGPRVVAGLNMTGVPTAVKKKKSFFSRVRPIVTRPYEWVRTFASRSF